MVLLVLKLLVFSHPLKLQRFPSIYVLLSLMGLAEYHFVMFLLCSRQSLCFPCTLYIVFCLNCFSYYSMVTKFFLLLYLPCLCYHTMIPALYAFTYCLIKIV